jgi:hypothetical protein
MREYRLSSNTFGEVSTLVTMRRVNWTEAMSADLHEDPEGRTTQTVSTREDLVCPRIDNRGRRRSVERTTGGERDDRSETTTTASRPK